MSRCPLQSPVRTCAEFDPALLGRREWVRRFVMGSAGVLVGSLTKQTLLAEISPSANPVNIIRVKLADFPALLADFGSVRLSLFNDSLPGGVVTINRAAGGNFHAISPICTHQGCIVEAYNHQVGVRSMICECHGSVYDIEGKITTAVQQGQASLNRFSSELADGVLRIEIPGLNLKVDSVTVVPGAASPRRMALTFPTKAGATYRVRFAQDPAIAPVAQPFFVSQNAVTSVNSVKQTAGPPNPRTVYAETTATRGFYFVEMVIAPYQG